ncbi:hypothetical protein HU200_031379 [Digitaria exilis]|uniref:Uncharacterized protein n=1 Tax=Digitaria exilis TaxID=1010633 RepID=A0A835BW32_9POAL|nr:hypothetical protein HU200_031379 [Digitaria exilis]
MEQDERPAAAAAAAADNAGCHVVAVSESDEEENVEVILDYSSGGASGSEFQDPPMIPFLGSSEQEALTEESSEGITPVSNAGQDDAFRCSQNEDYENMPKGNTATTLYELRGFRPARRAIAHAMPPSSYRRLPLRSRKQPIPTRFVVVVGDAASGVADAYHPGTLEEASCPVSPTSQPDGASAMVNASHGDNDEAIDSMVILSDRTGTSEMDAEASSGDRESGTDAKDAAEASSSGRLLSSRSRKQRRLDHFISDPEEAMSADRAKAHRSNTALDRFLTSSVAVGASPPEQRPGWVRKNMTADGVRHKGQPGNEEAFREASSGGGPEEQPDGSARVLAIVAILGASLALSVVCFVLIYIAGQQTASGACDTHQKKVSFLMIQ